MSALSYYILCIAVSAAFFFIVWGLLRDVGVETPWATAGVGASILLAGSVVLREFVLRPAKLRARQTKRQPDAATADGKLTVEQSASLLNEIKRRSDAANVLGTFSAGHKQVFELCAEYLNLIEAELQRMNPGSPRLKPFLDGRARAANAHRFHMLRWAEIEATELTRLAQSDDGTEDRARAAQKALSVINTALVAYPGERALIESKSLLTELAVSVEVRDHIARAESALREGDTTGAIRYYKEALFSLARDNISTPGREQAAERINKELESIRMAEQRRDRE